MTIIILHTTQWDIKIELESEKTPQTTKNFLQYIKEGFYNNTIFHRVIVNFMIQGGGLTTELSEKTTRPSIENEAKLGLKNKIGTIAMARTSDPHSASSQFFINVADNNFLDFKSETTDGFGYCAFGKVIEGLDIVKKISLIKTRSLSGHTDVPIETITINSAECLSENIV